MRSNKAMQSAAHAGLWIALLVFSCGDDRQHTVSSSFSSFDGPGVGVTFKMGGVVVTMDASVNYKYEFRSATGLPSTKTQTLNGLDFELVNGGFRLGETLYDGLADGDRVLITQTGILVNDLRRWDFPTR